MRSAALLVVSCCALASCATTASEQLRSPALPPTDGDPLPYTPAPEASGETDRTVSLTAAGGEDQARQMLPRFLRALRDGDQRELEQILAEEVVMLQGHGEPRPQARADVVRRMLLVASRSLIQPDVAVEDLVDLPTVNVTRAAQHYQAGGLPAGVRTTDVVLEVTLSEVGRPPLRALLRWELRGALVVRPGREPRIVAL